MTTMNDPFRHAIRQQIDRMGLSIAATAREAEVGRSELSLFLNERRGLRLDKLARVLNALGIEIKPRRARRARATAETAG